MNKITTVKITIDGEHIVASSNDTILDVANRLGIKIPTLCHDSRLKPYSSCFVCVVQINGNNNLQPSCSTKVADNMIIETNNTKVRESRKAALDLLLSNHYADCEAPCKQTCPAGVDVQGYISLIEKKMFSKAIELIKEVNPLPAICGRVCVRPCEVACRRNLMDEDAAVGIDYLKRFAADVDLNSNNRFTPKIAPSTGKKIAVIGAGPGGLSAAYFLQLKGHQVDIFESKPYAGGWLRYGIPQYRLPNNLLDSEVKTITDTGVNIFYNMTLGDNLSYKRLSVDYHSTVLTIGSQKGTLLGVDGEEAENVFSGVDFLRNMEVTGKPADFTGKTVVVVGGGNTAMDCCRTSQRCGAKKTYVVYRRTEKEMPANPIEIHESKLEGVEYLLLTNPVKVNADESGKLKSLSLIKMKLGEPDASGRRRPEPIDGSEYDLEVDFCLAAIGQKTDINFIDDINNNSTNGQLKPDRWGNINVNSKTLQTDVESVFAAGDGVTGPATIIEAIAQARIAANSCHQFLMGEEVKPFDYNFVSKKSNFTDKLKGDIIGKYVRQKRYEMAVLDPDQRLNFNEVELGYDNQDKVLEETNRCLECGCTEVFNCDLKNYSSEYSVDQKRFAGDYLHSDIDFSHPLIEIDNNKCILCSRCIRICDEVVGANALGLINRGFKSVVAPSMKKSLLETNCESCGLCISTCPTGAITENFTFKPGPVKTEKSKVVCQYCSVGCELELHHINGFVMKSTGIKGMSNPDGNLCKLGKFGYRILNNNNRIKTPLKRIGDNFVPISFDEAYKTIVERIRLVRPNENGFFAGSRLTNEEQYLVQKLARAGARTNNISSFYYLNIERESKDNCIANVPFNQIAFADNIYLFGTNLVAHNQVVGFNVNIAQKSNNAKVTLVCERDILLQKRKCNDVVNVKSYLHFIRAVNYYLILNNKVNKMFINDVTVGFQKYKTALFGLSYIELIEKSGVSEDYIVEFANEYNLCQKAILIFAEKDLNIATVKELINLALITGKLGKQSSGVVCLKENSNAQGLFDMGVSPYFGVAGVSIDDKRFAEKALLKWGIPMFKPNLPDMESLLKMDLLKNILIFGEDPIGTAKDKEQAKKWIQSAEFVIVQDLFMSETAAVADIILPASWSYQTGGWYTDSNRNVKQFDAAINLDIERSSWQQINDILLLLKVKSNISLSEVREEIFAFIENSNGKDHKYKFTFSINMLEPLFNNGCGILENECQI